MRHTILLTAAVTAMVAMFSASPSRAQNLILENKTNCTVLVKVRLNNGTACAIINSSSVFSIPPLSTVTTPFSLVTWGAPLSPDPRVVQFDFFNYSCSAVGVVGNTTCGVPATSTISLCSAVCSGSSTVITGSYFTSGPPPGSPACNYWLYITH